MYQKLLMILGSVLAIAFVFFFMRNWNSMRINDFDGCAAAGYPVMESYPRQCRTPDGRNFVEDIEPIGGERDENGCLGPAGYSFSGEVGACIRTWELNATQMEAARVAVDHIGWEYATTIIQVQGGDCAGCFTVELERGEDRERRDVVMENYTVTTVSLIPEECEGLEGRIVTTTDGAGCNETEENLGNVTGFISPAICCK